MSKDLEKVFAVANVHKVCGKPIKDNEFLEDFLVRVLTMSTVKAQITKSNDEGPPINTLDKIFSE